MPLPGGGPILGSAFSSSGPPAVHASSHEKGGSDLADLPSIDGIRTKWITLLEPDKIQAVIDNVPMFAVESDQYPNGITIKKVFLKTDANSTLAINVERWTSPLDGAPTTIVNIATAASAEAASGALSFDVAAGEIVMLDLDTTNVNWAQVGVSFILK